MQRFLLMAGDLMLGYLDLCVGFFLMALAQHYGWISIPSLFLPVGSLFAIAPDLDIIPQRLFRWDIKKNHHETLFHRPAFGIPAGALLGFFLFQSWQGALFGAVCIFYHYVHDTWAMSQGISWAWPFSENLFSFGGGWHAPKQGSTATHEDNLQHHWLAPTSRSVTEMLLGTVFLCVALSYVFPHNVSVFVALIPLLGAVCLWSIAPSTGPRI